MKVVAISMTCCAGGGYLFELMKKCQKKRTYRELDEALDVKLKPFLYNEVNRNPSLHNSMLTYTVNME